MRIFAFSDWRDQSIGMLNEAIQLESPDFILYAGDDLRRVVPRHPDIFIKTKKHFTKFNSQSITDQTIFEVNEKNLDLFFEIITKLEYVEVENEINSVPFLYVNGNDDVIEEYDGNYYIRISSLSVRLKHVNYSISETRERRITVTEREIGDDFNTGFYQQLKYNPSFGLNTLDAQLSCFGLKCGRGIINEVYRLPDQYVDVLLVHLPPLGCLDLSVRYGCKHIGSKKLLRYIEKYQPRYVICGHAHLWGGKIQNINNTTVINISSHDIEGSEGNYAIIDNDSGEIFLKSCKFKNLRQIRGAFFTDEENLRIYGSCRIPYVHNLYSLKNDDIIESLEQNGKSRIVARIQSLLWDKPIIIKKLSFNPTGFAFIDIETGLPQRKMDFTIEWKPWLIGLLYKGMIIQYEYPRQKKEFISFVEEQGITSLVSWTSFDSQILKNVKGLKGINWIDACKRVSNCVVWHSYKLHELYDVIFDNVDHQIIDGAIAGLYADHLINKKASCKFCPSEEQVKIEIKERNKKDLIQMYELCELLWNFDAIS